MPKVAIVIGDYLVHSFVGHGSIVLGLKCVLNLAPEIEIRERLQVKGYGTILCVPPYQRSQR